MATISSIAVDVAMRTSQFTLGTKRVLDQTKSLVGGVSVANVALEKTSGAIDSVGRALMQADVSAKSFIKTTLGLAGAGAMIGHAVKAFSASQQAQKAPEAAGVDATGRANEIATLSDSYQKLSGAVGNAYLEFGKAFATSADLNKTMELMRGAVQSVTSVISTFGSVLGSVVGWMVNTPPVFLFAVVAVKALAAALAFAAHVMISRWIVAQVTTLLLGKAMTAGQLVWIGVTYAWAAACTVASAAMWLVNAAALAGLPIWGAIAVVALAFVAVIAVVAGAVYGLVKAWQHFTSVDPAADKAARMKDLAEEAKKAGDAVADMDESLAKNIAQFGMSDQEKDLASYSEKLEGVRRLFGDAVAEEMLATRKANLEKLAALESQKKALEAVRKVESDMAEKVRTAGWSEETKAIDDYAAKLSQVQGLSKAEYQSKLDTFAAQQDQLAAVEQQKKLVQELAEIEKTTSQVGLTATQKKLADLAKLGATQRELAAASTALNNAEAQQKTAENRKSIEQAIADLQKDAAQAGLTAAQKRLADLKKLGATETQLAEARKAQEKSDIAEKAKALRESVETPFEKFSKQINEIAKLRDTPDGIDDSTANRAATAAHKSFRESLNLTSTKVESPQALLRGTAEAALAADRNKSPLETLTELQRQHLAQGQQLLTATNLIVANTKPNEIDF